MSEQESECWKSAQLWHERALKAEAEIERLRIENIALENSREAYKKAWAAMVGAAIGGDVCRESEMDTEARVNEVADQIANEGMIVRASRVREAAVEIARQRHMIERLRGFLRGLGWSDEQIDSAHGAPRSVQLEPDSTAYEDVFIPDPTPDVQQGADQTWATSNNPAPDAAVPCVTTPMRTFTVGGPVQKGDDNGPL